MIPPVTIPNRNKISSYDINYFRAVFALASISYLLLSFYLVPGESAIREFLLEGKFIAIIPAVLLILTFALPAINQHLSLIVNFLFLFSTLHLLGFIAINEFAGKYEAILIGLILVANLHLERIVFVVLYNVLTVTVLEYVFIMTAPSTNVQPALFFIFLIAAMLVSIPYQLYRIRYIAGKTETDILNEGLLKGNPDAWLLLEGPGLIIKDASDKALELFGIKNDLEHISLRSLIASTTTLEADNIIRSILSNNSFTTVTLCRKASGELFHADVSAYKIPGDKKYIQCRFIETSKSIWNKENQEATENAIRYRSYLDLTDSGIIICDHSGKIRICNKQVVQIFNHDLGLNFSDQPLENLTGTAAAQIIRKQFDTIQSNQLKYSKETTENGNGLVLDFTVSKINDIIDFSDEILILVESIDKRRKLNGTNSLPANATSLNNEMPVTTSFEFLAAVVTDSNGLIIQANNSFQQLTGYSRIETKNLKIDRILFPGDLGTFHKLTQELSGPAEIRIISKTGDTIFVNCEIEANHLQNEIKYLFYNITRYKNTNEALLEANSNVTAVVENTDDPIFSVDFNHRITVMNSAFESEFNKRLGRKPQVGDDYRNYISKKEIQNWNTGFDLAMKGNKSRHDEVNNYPDNSIEYFETSFHPITTKDNLIIGVSVHSRNVTDRIRFEKEIIAAKEVAEKATNAKSSFLATMSHEIRTPLNGLLGMSELLTTTNLTKEQKEFVDSIQISGEALLSVINDVLDFSRIESDKMELEQRPFELRSVVTETLNILNYRAKEQNNSIDFKISNDIPKHFTGDKARLRQILVNLVGNAVKFTTAGSISVNADGNTIGQGIWEIKFSVKDTGIGMSEEQIKKLFQSFSQADATTYGKYGGSGLGLAISSKLTQLMNGTMWVESREGEGSVFYFTIKLPESKTVFQPAVTNGHSGIRNTQENKHIATDFPLRILVAEDNAVNQTLAKASFKNLGYTIDIAENGQRAVELALTKVYDLIFMDVQMPVMTGVEATVAITQQLKPNEKPVIIAMTAFALEGDKDKCFAAGMDDYLPKPFIIEDLRRIILKYGKQLSSQSILQQAKTEVSVKPPVSKIDLIDYSMLDRLKEMADDDAEFLKTLVELFISQSDETVEEMNVHFKGNDIMKLSQSAHKLKGSSLNLGAKHLAEICRVLEAATDNYNKTQVEEHLKLMEDIYPQTKAALKTAVAIK